MYSAQLAEPKKSRWGLIIGAAAGVLLLTGGAVGFMLMNSGGESVAQADTSSSAETTSAGADANRYPLP